jgi:hypothetical protein
VYNGASKSDAVDIANEYIRSSKSDYGRAAGEDVTVLRDSVAVIEFEGRISRYRDEPEEV